MSSRAPLVALKDVRLQDGPVQLFDGVNLALNADGPTLILFVHPRCPCTRASLSELERVLSSCQGSRRAYVVAYRPASAEAGWEHTDLWRTASKLPGVRLLSDADGTLARVEAQGKVTIQAQGATTVSQRADVALNNSPVLRSGTQPLRRIVSGAQDEGFEHGRRDPSAPSNRHT